MSKISFSEFHEFGPKVKKEKTKKTSPQIHDGVQEQRHEKINFKTYLRGLKEDQATDDEYQDIAFVSANDLAFKWGCRTVDLSASSGMVNAYVFIEQADWEDILVLEKDDSITIIDEPEGDRADATNGYVERWYVTRTLTNQIVFENQDGDVSGKMDYAEFVKKLK